MTGTRSERLVFVDVSGATIRWTPLMARAPRGQRCLGQVPRNWGQTTTLLAAMTGDGVAAALLVEEATDQPVFDILVTDVLAPQSVPDQIVVWDNLNVLKSRRAISDLGCELRFLPPYSPDFNPSEQAFGKLKGYLRRVEARTRLWEAIGTELQQITAQLVQPLWLCSSRTILMITCLTFLYDLQQMFVHRLLTPRLSRAQHV